MALVCSEMDTGKLLNAYFGAFESKYSPTLLSDS